MSSRRRRRTCRRRSRSHSSRRKCDSRWPRPPAWALAPAAIHEIVTLPGAFDSARTPRHRRRQLGRGRRVAVHRAEVLDEPLIRGPPDRIAHVGLAHQLRVELVVVKRDFHDRGVEFVVDVRLLISPNSMSLRSSVTVDPRLNQSGSHSAFWATMSLLTSGRACWPAGTGSALPWSGSLLPLYRPSTPRPPSGVRMVADKHAIRQQRRPPRGSCIRHSVGARPTPPRCRTPTSDSLRIRRGRVSLDPVQAGLVLARQRPDVADAVAEANHVGDDHTARRSSTGC